MAESEQVFLRLDLNEATSDKVAYYRADEELVDFLNRIKNSRFNIEGVILTTKDNGDFGLNLGFIVDDTSTELLTAEDKQWLEDLLKGEK